MASKSQTTYMTAIALVIGVTDVMNQHYNPMPGRERIKGLVSELKSQAEKALLLAHGGLNDKQIEEIKEKIGDMQTAGLEGADSCQVYISMLIGIVSELIMEIPEHSAKYGPLSRILDQLENIYIYFSNRTRTERFDVAGMALMESFNQNFKGESVWRV